MPVKRKYNILQDPLDIKGEDVAMLLEKVGFGKAEYYMKNKFFMTDWFCAGTRGFFAVCSETKDLLGFARVFSDNYRTTWISEICVLPEYQKQGIGKHMMMEIIKALNHTYIYLEAFYNQTAFFDKAGLKVCPKLVTMIKDTVGNNNNYRATRLLH